MNHDDAEVESVGVNTPLIMLLSRGSDQIAIRTESVIAIGTENGDCVILISDNNGRNSLLKSRVAIDQDYNMVLNMWVNKLKALHHERIK